MSRSHKFLGKMLYKMAMGLEKKPVRYSCENWFTYKDREYKVTLESFDKEKEKKE